VALRTMLPSAARVGDTIHFAFPYACLSRTPISGFEVTINGRKLAKPEIVLTRITVGGHGAANFVFRANEPGTFQFKIAPIVGGKKGQSRINTLEVTP
jgi:hypothetical protein